MPREKENVMNRVVVTKSMMGIFSMQVCAEKDAKDEEILEVCDRENPAGTTNGWGTVVRVIQNVIGVSDDYDGKNQLPVQCEKDPERLHFIVYC